MATDIPLTPTMEFLGKLAYGFTLVQPFLPTYLHLLISALFPIYIGAHASLSRPDSASKPEKKKGGHDSEDLDNTDDEDEEEDEQKMEGLSPGDAILFPLMAGTTTAGLYFLIKWLGDPALLNMLMNGYLSLMGIYSVGKLFGDSLNICTSYIFPKVWREGSNVIRVDNHEKGTYTVKDGLKLPRGPSNPLPGYLSKVDLSPKPRAILWTIRGLFTEKWTLAVRSHGKVLLRTKFGLNDMIGMVSGALVVLAYNFVSKTWWLTNLMGFGFSYVSLQFMSPTTFWTGTLILSALFFYDIYFVFYTPVMVTVATSLDVPIKLLFPRPAGPDADPAKQSLAMLGLGDVVIPGIMIGLAIRYDLYLHYLFQQNKPHESGNPEKTLELEKPSYQPATGLWGERFWLSSSDASPDTAPLTGGRFRKTYFHASIVGYVIGMLVTFTAMHISNHAQPALLYLVPGVLGSLWGTALVKGEVGMMWAFTEAIEEDVKEDAKKEESKQENPEKKKEIETTKTKDTNLKIEKADDEVSISQPETEIMTSVDLKSDLPKSEDDNPSPNDGLGHKRRHHSKSRQIFSITITAPVILKSTLHENEDSVSKTDKSIPSSLDTNGMPVGKRRRV